MNDYQDKKLISQNIQNIIIPFKEDYDVYFTTFTFHDNFKNPCSNDVQEYFKSFFQKMNNACLNRPSKNSHKKCILICFPEISYKNAASTTKKEKQRDSDGKKIKKKHPVNHYHGFLLIHKDNRKRFARRAVFISICEYYEQLEKFINIYILKPKFINFYRAQYKFFCEKRNDLIPSPAQPLNLRAFSIDLRLLETNEDVFRTCRYATKNFVKDFSYEDILVFSNMKKFTVT